MVQAFLNRCRLKEWPVYGVTVWRQGVCLGSWQENPNQRYPVYSATKSFTATAVGMAAQEGALCLQAPILHYLAKEIGELPPAQRAVWEKVSLERLLTMSVEGFPFRPREGEDWMKQAFCCPIHPEKRVFAYSNFPAYLVGAALENAVGESLMDYMRPRLLAPLGIADLPHRLCPRGHFYGASEMELTVEELALFGRLYEQKGCLGGTRYLSEAWVQQATSCQIENDRGGYGYFFWRYRDGFCIRGKWGQFCLINPKQHTVAACVAHVPKEADELLSMLDETLLRPLEA